MSYTTQAVGVEEYFAVDEGSPDLCHPSVKQQHGNSLV